MKKREKIKKESMHPREKEACLRNQNKISGRQLYQHCLLLSSNIFLKINSKKLLVEEREKEKQKNLRNRLKGGWSQQCTKNKNSGIQLLNAH